MEFKSISLQDAQIKFAKDGLNTFSGYASMFGGVDSDGDTIHQGAFTKALQNGTEVKMYYNHGWRKGEMPIGKMFVKQDSAGLFVERAEFTEGIKLADDISLAVKHGTIDGMSIAFGITETGFKRKSGRGKDIFEIELLKEISIVDFPADGNARITDMKSAIEEASTIREIEVLLRDSTGMARSEACLLVSRIKTMLQGELAAEKAKRDLEAVFKKYTK